MAKRSAANSAAVLLSAPERAVIVGGWLNKKARAPATPLHPASTEIEPLQHERLASVVVDVRQNVEEHMRYWLIGPLLVLLGQDAAAQGSQNSCLEALQRLAGLSTTDKHVEIVFTCEPSGNWSVAFKGAASAIGSVASRTASHQLAQAQGRALCAAGSTGDLHEPLRQFAAGEAWGRVQSESLAFDTVLRTKLDHATGLFGDCGGQNSQIRNAYELGVYSRKAESAAEGIARVDQAFRLAADRLNIPSAGTGRLAVEALRAELEKRGLLGVVTVNRDQLDDKLWPMIVACASRADTPPLPGASGAPSAAAAVIQSC